VLVAAPRSKRFVVERGAALGEEGAEPHGDELERVAQREPRPAVDSSDRPVREHVGEERQHLCGERDREPERHVCVELPRHVAPAGDRSHDGERCEEDHGGGARRRDERQVPAHPAASLHAVSLPVVEATHTEAYGRVRAGIDREAHGGRPD
jgi:hypothetical protein